MFGIFRDGVNIASFSSAEAAFKYGEAKGLWVRDLRKLRSGWWITGIELRDISKIKEIKD
jgi:hypothetical protein